MMRMDRRQFFAMTTITAGALSLPLRAVAGPANGQVAFAADCAWWDPQGTAIPCRFAKAPVVSTPDEAVLDWAFPIL